MINKEVVFFATTACWYEAAQCETDAAAPMQQWANNPRKTKQKKNIKMNRLVVVSLIFYQQHPHEHKQEEGKEKRIIRQKCERIVVYGQRVEISWTVGSPYVARKEKKERSNILGALLVLPLFIGWHVKFNANTAQSMTPFTKFTQRISIKLKMHFHLSQARFRFWL